MVCSTRFASCDAALFDQLVDELGVVQHVVVAAELRVLVLDRVEAVRAGRDHLAHPVGVHHLDVGLGQRLEEVLVAGSPRRVAAAALLFAQDGELDARLLEYLRPATARCAGCAHRTSRGSRPSRALPAAARYVGFGFCCVLDRWSPATLALDRLAVRERVVLQPRLARPLGEWARQALGPVCALVGGTPRGCLSVSRLRKSAGQLGREAALLHDQVAAHVGDLRHVLDEDRAGLHAGAAGGARPERLVHDPAADQGHAPRLRLRCIACLTPSSPRVASCCSGPLRSCLARSQRAGFEEMLLQVEDQLLGRERLVGQPGGAGVLAAPALGAGVGVHEVFPARSPRFWPRPASPRSRCAARCP